MALQHTRLMEAAFVPTSVGSVYANPSGKKSHVKGFHIHNTNAVTQSVAIHWVPDNAGSLGTAGNSNRIYKVTLAADDSLTLEFPYGIVMTDTNESIMASTTTANAVTIAVLGDLDF